MGMQRMNAANASNSILSPTSNHCPSTSSNESPPRNGRRVSLRKKLEKAKAKIRHCPRRGSLSSLSMVSELKITSDHDDSPAHMTESDYFPSDAPSDTDQKRRANIKYNLRNMKPKQTMNERPRRSNRLQNKKKDEREDALLNDEVVKQRKRRTSNRKRRLSQVESDDDDDDEDDDLDYFETNKRKRIKHNTSRVRSSPYSSLMGL